MLAGGGWPGGAQVVINEISSVQSDRLLQKSGIGPPRLGALPAWHENSFTTPGWWGSGPGPFGFGYTQATNVQSAMLGKTPVLYLRRDFSLTAGEAASGQPLELLIDYDDGFVAYVNGVEVARRNTGEPGSFAWHDQPAFNVRTSGTAELIALGPANGLLREGVNVLAVQAHNRAITDTRLFCSATLRVSGSSILIAPSDTWRWFAGTHEPAGGLYDGTDFSNTIALGPNWTQLDYSDATWGAGPGALGYDTAADYRAQIGTDLIAMRGITNAVHMRHEFTLTQAQYDALSATSLTVDWDDGYVLYLNGFELSRANLPGAPGSFVPFDQTATDHGASRDNGGNNPAAISAIPVPRTLLRAGRNVIAAQLHNQVNSSSDLLLDIRFAATSGGSTLPLVMPGSSWRYRIATTEIGTPFLPNSQTIAPEFLDWIELKNLGDAIADLSGWTLTDERAAPAKWTFPAGTSIGPGAFLVVACSGRNVVAPQPGQLLHTSFSLGAKGEYVGLSDGNGALRSELTNVPDQNAHHTWGRDNGNGIYRFLDRGTPGAENGAGTAGAISSEVIVDKPSGFYSSSTVITLSTTTPGAAIHYTLDGSDPTTASSRYTAPFDAGIRPNVGPGTGTILREMFQWSSGVVVVPPNLSPTATPTSTQLLTALETPSNISDYYTHRVRGFLHPPQSGNYQFWLATDDDGELWLSTDDSATNRRRIANIVGNWAGSREWNKLASQRSASIALLAGQRYYIEVLQSEGSGGDNLAVGWSGPGLPAGINVLDGRYLSPPATLPPGTTQPPGYATVRARAFAAGHLPSPISTRNYVIGIDSRLTTVPAFFFSGPADDTFYAPNGIFSVVGGNWNNGPWVPNDVRFDYNFCLMHGEAFERPAELEIVQPGNQLFLRTTVGARFSGSPWSRPQYRLADIENASWNAGWLSKPQINIFFRGDYGISRLRSDGFIPTSRLNEWDQLRLRAGKNDAYNPFIIDEWMRRSFAGMGAPSPQGIFATLFINGHFKSYFNPTERPREPFFQEFFRSDYEWDVNYNNEWENGDGTAYSAMRSFFLNNDFTLPAAYQQAAALWEMTNVADYFVLNAWGATQDWPHNNFIFMRERAAGAKWRFSMWDAEGAFGLFGQSNQHNTFDRDLLVPENGARSPAMNADSVMTRLVFRRAYQNAEFRLLFADRLQKHFFNGGGMTRQNMTARWDGLRSTVAPLIAAVSGGQFSGTPWNSWAGRDTVFLTQCRNIGLWPATVAPSVVPFGGAIPPGGLVTMNKGNSADTIIYTTDGSDPRAAGGAVQGTPYSAPFPVPTPMTVKARARSSTGEWSPLVEANFAPPAASLAITEIYYNPPDPDDLTEFIELTNVSNEVISLNGAHFTDGIDFTFGNISLAPSARVVLVKDSAAFSAAYPGVTIGGTFNGNLDNSGETITLRDIADNILVTVTYGDGNIAGWPAAADGNGASLVLRRAFFTGTNPALPASWRASIAPGGTPGALDSTQFSGDPFADQDADGFNALMEHAFGTNDRDALSKPELETRRDTLGHAQINFLHPAAADDVIIEALESTDLSTWRPAQFEGDVGETAALLRASWRSESSGSQTFMRVRVRFVE